MSASRDPTTGPTVELHFVTRDALKQFEALCPKDQCLVARAIAQPPPRNRCELVQGLKKDRVYHFRASETLRVSFQDINTGACVVHIGTHAEFDRFAEHYDGYLAYNPIPLKETPIMAKINATTAAENSVATGPSDATSGRIAEMAELFGAAMQEVLAQAQEEILRRVESGSKSLQESLQKLERKVTDTANKADKDIAQLRADSQKQDSFLGEKIKQAETLCRDLSSQVRGLQTDLEQLVDASDQALKQARTELNDQLGRTAAELREQFKAGLERLATDQTTDRQAADQQWHSAQERLAEAERRAQSAEDHLRQLDGRVHTLEAQSQHAAEQLSGALASLQGKFEAADDRRRQSEDQLAGLIQAIGGLTEQVHHLAVELSDLQTQHQQLRQSFTDVARQVEALTCQRQRRLASRLGIWLRRACDRLRSKQTGNASQERPAGNLPGNLP